MNNYCEDEISFIKMTNFHKKIFNFMLRRGMNPIRILEDIEEKGKVIGQCIVIKANYGKTPFTIEFSPNGKNIFINIEPNFEELLEFLIEEFTKETSTIPICSYVLNQKEFDENNNIVGTTFKSRVAEISFDELKSYYRIKNFYEKNSFELFKTDDLFATEFVDYTNYKQKMETVRYKYQSTANLPK